MTEQIDLCDVSVVIPLWNEEDNIRELSQRIYIALCSLGLDYEVIYIDDGSTDKSAKILEAVVQEYNEIRVIFLAKNFGQHSAMLAGLKHARGRILITMDGDLQSDPADIPRFLDKLNKGYDLVAGYRIERKAHLLRRQIPSMVVNYIFKKMTRITLRDYGCTFRAFTRESAKEIFQSGNMQKYSLFFLPWKGCKFSEIAVTDSRRQRGDSKYIFSRLLLVLFDVLITFSAKPSFLVLGLLSCCMGMGVFMLFMLKAIFQARLLISLLIASLFFLFFRDLLYY